MRKTALLCLLLFALVSPSWGQGPKVFLMIGDGMGKSQIESGALYISKPLWIQTMACRGRAFTGCLGAPVTDSAAAGTAIATGHKTAYGVVAMDKDGKRPFETLGEIARKMAMKVGIISSVSIDSATPACFYAHQANRKDYYDISLQIPKSSFDFFAGGGLLRPRGVKKNKPDAWDILKERGFKVFDASKDLADLTPSSLPAYFLNPVIVGGGAMAYAIDRDKASLSLRDFTKKAIELLDGPEGFFIMVEGGKIDWACHQNDGASAVMDTLAFDEAVGAALEFQALHPEALVVVTADHETGGMDISRAFKNPGVFKDVLGKQKASQEVLGERILSLRKSKGKGSKLSEVLPFLLDSFALDWETLTERERNSLKVAFALSMTEPSKRPKGKEFSKLYGWHDPFSVTVSKILNQRAGISFKTFGHTGEPVPVYASGLGAELFQGDYENTEIFTKILKVLQSPREEGRSLRESD